MATYAELYTLSQDATLMQRVASACAVHAQAVIVETPRVLSRYEWARSALANPMEIAGRMIWYLLSSNASYTPAQISGSTDAVLLSAVETAVNNLEQMV